MGAKRLRREQLQHGVERALDLLGNAGYHYMRAADMHRRMPNRELLDRIWLSDDEVVAGQLTDPYAQLVDTELASRLVAEVTGITLPRDPSDLVRSRPAPASHRHVGGTGPAPRMRKNQRPEGAGSNVPILVAGAVS